MKEPKEFKDISELFDYYEKLSRIERLSVLKELYADISRDLFYEENPFLKVIKSGIDKGQLYPIPLKTGEKRKK